MGRPSRLILLFLACATGFACRGTHPAPIYAWDQAASFSGMKTYAWYDGPDFKMPHGDSIIDGQFIDRTVRQAVDEIAREEGFPEGRRGERLHVRLLRHG